MSHWPCRAYLREPTVCSCPPMHMQNQGSRLTRNGAKPHIGKATSALRAVSYTHLEQGFEVIDCGDGLIIPGMIDAHMHFFDGIFQNSRYMCRDLFDCRSAEECVKVIGDFARKHPEYRTVTGMGWFPSGWTDSRRPCLLYTSSDRTCRCLCIRCHWCYCDFIGHIQSGASQGCGDAHYHSCGDYETQ